MVSELVETTRLWGRTAAKIDPRWVEPLAEHLVRRSYEEPRWEKQARLGRGHRARDAVRAADRRRARRRVRRARPGPLARPVHPARAGRGRLGHAPPLPGRQPAARRGGRGARGARAPARHPRRRPDALRLLLRPHPGDDRLRRALRPLVARRAPGPPGPADVHARAADQPGGRRGRARAPGHVAPGRERAPADLPLRARKRPRRRDRARPAQDRCPSCAPRASSGWCPRCARSW